MPHTIACSGFVIFSRCVMVLRVPESQWLTGGVETSALYGTLEYCDSLRSNSHDGATDCRCSIDRQLDLCDFDFGQFATVWIRLVLRGRLIRLWHTWTRHQRETISYSLAYRYLVYLVLFCALQMTLKIIIIIIYLSNSLADCQLVSPSLSSSPLSSFITPSLFHSGLKTYLFN